MVEEKKESIDGEEKEVMNRIKELLNRTDIELDEKISSIKNNEFISAGIDRLLKKNARPPFLKLCSYFLTH